ncbi:ATP-binding protein [Clostridium sp. CX1]|uniref:hybrid sensor histidine kinase/response regulator n=1 Tax=Clostridium sp. CX1 TaxID=2978346 RepID=UPI0021C19E79|nr:ATP-binding protein [Clostridium sp. CX1]MCT8977394.1 ATP-binding protein [Clostridium sp. CX1]
MEELIKKILLVEDDYVDQIVFKRLIKNEKLNYEYCISDSVLSAKEALLYNKFDVVILDYDLGDGTAFDLMNIIGDTPIIFTTGAGDEETAVKAMRSGVYDYLIKDIDKNYIKLLPSIIENAIKNRKDKEQLAMLSQAIMTINDSVYITDKDYSIKFVNSAFCRTYGYSSSEIIGRKSYELWDKERNFYSTNEYLSKNGSGEFKHRKKDGSVFPVFLSRSIVNNEGRTDRTLINISRDITEKVETDKMKSEFVSTVSHEIRTPLTVMLALSQLLLTNDTLSEEKLKKYYNTMHTETKRLTNLVNDFLDIQRMESGRKVLNREKICIVDVVEEVISLYEVNETHELIVDMDKVDYSPIFADSQRMIQLLTNLVSNAIKYSPENREIRIVVRELETEIRVSVVDKGLGIPKDSIPMLFTKFYRVDNSDHRKVGGTGLGLVICKEIVNAHEGKIGVNSKLNEGSEFYFTIPKIIS